MLNPVSNIQVNGRHTLGVTWHTTEAITVASHEDVSLTQLLQVTSVLFLGIAQWKA